MGIIHYLEMKSKNEHNISELKDKEFTINMCQIKQFKLNKFLYNIVGEPFLWFDKSNISDNKWKKYVDNPNLYTWVAYKKGAIAGYFELLKEHDFVEIKYFGLTTDFIGQGLGSGFLSYAINQAWSFGPDRVILNTCDKDHKNALKNYLDRGFKKIEEEIT